MGKMSEYKRSLSERAKRRMAQSDRVDVPTPSYRRKPAISDYFTEGRLRAMCDEDKHGESWGLVKRHSGVGLNTGSTAASCVGCCHHLRNGIDANVSGLWTQRRWRDGGILVHTPSVSEPVRHGPSAPLNEASSLQVKHAGEYEVIIPSVGHALQRVVQAHEKWLQETVSSPAAAPLCGGATSRVKGINRNNASINECFKAFEKTVGPSVTLPDFVRMMVERTLISPSVLVVACLYIDRLLLREPSLCLNMNNIFGFFIISLRVASKVMDIRVVTNKDYAAVTGINSSKLYNMEITFSHKLRFDLYVSSAEFKEYASGLTSPASQLVNPITCRCNTQVKDAKRSNTLSKLTVRTEV